MRYISCAAMAILLTSASLPAQEPLAGRATASRSAEEIVRRVEANDTFDSARFEGKLAVRDRYGLRETGFALFSAGKDKVLVRFTTGEEKGQKILRAGKDIYLFYPDAEEVIRLQGAALKEAVLGSDFSYEDMTGEKSLLEQYAVVLEGGDFVEGFPCKRVAMTAKSRSVPYQRQIIWVDESGDFVRKAEYYSLSGKILKTLLVLLVERKAGKTVATRSIMTDAVKKGTSTEFIVARFELDARIDPKVFSLEELSW